MKAVALSVLAFHRIVSTRVARNIVANYAGSAISAAAPLIAVPFLVTALGPSMWGLVAFATVLVSTLAILNAGLAQSMVREIGLRWSMGEAGRSATRRLMFSYERIYWIAALVIAAAVFPFAGVIVHRWLNIDGVPPGVATASVQLAIALFFVQLPSAIYRTTLSALQAQVLQNGVQVVAAVIKAVGGVAIALMTRSIIAYLVWLVVVSALETLALAVLAWRQMPGGRAGLKWDTAEVRKTLQFSATMSLVVTLGMATTMVDKFYVSGHFPIAQLGVYSIAASVGFGVLQVSYPVFNAVLPRLVEVGGDAAARKRANLKLLGIMGAIVVLFGAAYLVAGDFALSVWLQDRALSVQVKQVLDLILISSALNMVYNIGYTNWVSLGESRWVASINVVSFAAALIVTPVSIDLFGLKGAAAALIAMNSIGAISAIVWLILSGSRESLLVSDKS